MSGSSVCRLEPGPSFVGSLDLFLKGNFGKHEAKGRDEARAAVQTVLERLFSWPAVSGSHPEPYPPKSKAGDQAAKAGWSMHKIEFNVPRLSGAAKCGRLIYMVHKDDRVVVPLCVYTHKQYAGRVPDKALEAMIAEAEEQKSEPKPAAALVPQVAAKPEQ